MTTEQKCELAVRRAEELQRMLDAAGEVAVHCGSQTDQIRSKAQALATAARNAEAALDRIAHGEIEDPENEWPHPPDFIGMRHVLGLARAALAELRQAIADWEKQG